MNYLISFSINAPSHFQTFRKLKITNSLWQILTPFLFFYFLLLENLALGKPTWQKHPFNNDWGADKAVDGWNKDMSAGGGRCTISSSSANIAEWRVDLEAKHSIHHIVIHYRTDNFEWSKYHFSYFYFLKMEIP